MKKFGSDIRIHTTNESNIGLCSSAPISNNTWTVVRTGSSGVILKAKYHADGSLETVNSIPYEDDAFADGLKHAVFSDERFIVFQFESGNSIRLFDKDFSLLNSVHDSTNTLRFPVVDEVRGSIYYMRGELSSARIRKMDFSLNTLWDIGVENADDIVLTKSGRLFYPERDSSSRRIVEVDISDGRLIASVQVPLLEGGDAPTPRRIMELESGRLAVVCSGGATSQGAILVYTQDLEHVKTINGSDVNVNIGGSTFTPFANSYFDEKIAITSSVDETTSMVDVENETRLWRVGNGGIRFTELTIDSLGFTVCSGGIGSDPNHVMVVDIDGNRLFVTSRDDDGNLVNGDRGVGVHYQGWRRRLF